MIVLICLVSLSLTSMYSFDLSQDLKSTVEHARQHLNEKFNFPNFLINTNIGDLIVIDIINESKDFYNNRRSDFLSLYPRRPRQPMVRKIRVGHGKKI